ncbi:hypothetical protein, partial [Streptomyces sp. NPDC002889]|uniref:hypothetical protein n=1 Tax=Streptomyces sp. NPDC002889 TaxID=3364669 RepID=UPI0036C4E679
DINVGGQQKSRATTGGYVVQGRGGAAWCPIELLKRVSQRRRTALFTGRLGAVRLSLLFSGWLRRIAR